MGKYILPAELCRDGWPGQTLPLRICGGGIFPGRIWKVRICTGPTLPEPGWTMPGCPVPICRVPYCRTSACRGACCRWADFSQADARGADFFRAVMEYTRTDGLLTDGSTRWFRMHCPEQGAFVAYKKCADMRLVQLLIPAEARRVAATSTWGRCDRAKVLTIKSFDYRERFTEATSLQTDSFVYRVGQWVSEPRFDPDRWLESAPGIYFWLTRQEAYDY